MNIFHRIQLVICCSVFAACNENNFSSVDPAEFNSEIEVVLHGEIEARQLSNLGLDFHAVFMSMNTAFSFGLLESEYLEVRDECNVINSSSRYIENPYTLRTTYGPPEKFGQFVTVSAGESIEFLKSDGTPFWELLEYSDTNFSRYSHDPDPFDDQQFGGADVIPQNMTANIPGNTFPAYSTVDIPNIATLITTKPTQGSPIDANTQFEWNASNRPGASLRIIATDRDKTVECMVIDDGNFSFSAETKMELGPDFSATEFLLARTQVALYKKSNSSLLVRRTSNYIHP